jgi:hypothetical protein
MRKKKMLTILCITSGLIICFFVGLYIIGIRGEAYKYASEFLDSNKSINERIGALTSKRLALFGYSVRYSGPSAHAEYKIRVKGQNGEGSVYLKLEKSAGIWEVTQANLVLDNGKTVSLVN